MHCLTNTKVCEGQTPDICNIFESAHNLDPDGEDITMEGTMQLCEDLGVNPDEDCVLYAIAFELKSPRMGEWNKKGWTEGWKNLGYGLHLNANNVPSPKLIPQKM
jgi:hypothetical protein